MILKKGLGSILLPLLILVAGGLFHIPSTNGAPATRSAVVPVSTLQHELRATVAADLLATMSASRSADRPVRVIIQTKGRPAVLARALVQRHSLLLHRVLPTIDALAASVPAGKLRALATDADVKWLSPDRTMESVSGPEVFGHLAVTTGADQVVDSTLVKGVSGKGVGVAVLDSGVWPGGKDYGLKIKYFEDFTDEHLEDQDKYGGDLYGHGTHVASVITGSGEGSSPDEDFGGIARDADLIVLRVLDSQGKGWMSEVIAAVERVLELQNTYKIGVINLSLGSFPGESYRTDPLCQALEHAVGAGLVVVVSAGNHGQDEEGNIVYGGILTPAIDPTVITVGAVETLKTDWRSDDLIAGFSSRGPTMGCDDETLESCDMLLKPDIAAPGVRIEGLSSPDNYLYTQYPATHLEDGNTTYFYLSGTSVAAPVVTGTVALMLEANGSLTPNLIKAILQYSAAPVPGAEFLDQGAGQVNIAGAVAMAMALTDKLDRASPGDPHLDDKVADLPQPVTTIAGESLTWFQGFFWEWRATHGDAPFRTVVEPWLNSSSLMWGGGLTYWEWAETQAVGDESLIWGGSYAWKSSLLWGGSLMWGGAILDVSHFAPFDRLLEENPLDGTSLLWGGRTGTPTVTILDSAPREPNPVETGIIP